MEENEITDEYDREFISLMLTIEKRSEDLNKYDKLRIKNWCKKLCQITNNIEWKKNRNLHAICILDSILNKHFEEPYNKFPPEGSVPILNKALVKSKLTKKFFEETMNMKRDEEQFEQQQSMDNNNYNYNYNLNENNIEDDNYNNNNNFNNDYNYNIKSKKKNSNNINDNRYIKIIKEQREEIIRLNELLRQKENDIEILMREKIQMQTHIDELEQVIEKYMENEKSGE